MRRTLDGIIFDLDGTLWDASAASADGWNSGLEIFGDQAPRLSADDIRSVTGRPFEECVTTLIPNPPTSPETPESLFDILNRYEKNELERKGGRLYPGVAECLPRLAACYPLFIVSNCQEWYLSCFFSLTGLGRHFVDADCHGRLGLPKSGVIADLVKRHSLKQAVYVGDTAGDEEAAKLNSLPFLYTAYGFGRPSGDAPTFHTFNELTEHLLGPK